MTIGSITNKSKYGFNKNTLVGAQKKYTHQINNSTGISTNTISPNKLNAVTTNSAPVNQGHPASNISSRQISNRAGFQNVQLTLGEIPPEAVESAGGGTGKSTSVPKSNGVSPAWQNTWDAFNAMRENGKNIDHSSIYDPSKHGLGVGGLENQGGTKTTSGGEMYAKYDNYMKRLSDALKEKPQDDQTNQAGTLA
jgi:hypothetical protein